MEDLACLHEGANLELAKMVPRGHGDSMRTSVTTEFLLFTILLRSLADKLTSTVFRLAQPFRYNVASKPSKRSVLELGMDNVPCTYAGELTVTLV